MFPYVPLFPSPFVCSQNLVANSDRNMFFPVSPECFGLKVPQSIQSTTGDKAASCYPQF